MRTFDLDDLTLGDLAEQTRTTVKAAASDILRLSTRYKREGAARHEAPLRAAHGSLTDCLRSLDQGIEMGGRDLAVAMEKALGEPVGPCPHARPDWRMCPHCNGLNAAAEPTP